jgi:hypothetical protein
MEMGGCIVYCLNHIYAVHSYTKMVEQTEVCVCMCACVYVQGYRKDEKEESHSPNACVCVCVCVCVCIAGWIGGCDRQAVCVSA